MQRIKFEPDTLDLKKAGSTQKVTVTLAEQVISPPGGAAGLAIVVSSLSENISIYPSRLHWPEHENESNGDYSFLEKREFTVELTRAVSKSEDDVVVVDILTESELYKGYVPEFTVNLSSTEHTVGVGWQIAGIATILASAIVLFRGRGTKK
jgi:hypothetical protein